MKPNFGDRSISGKESIMSILKKLYEKLAFDKPDTRYELLEVESGEPKHLFGWNDVPPQPPEGKQQSSTELRENESKLKTMFRFDINKDVVFTKCKAGCKTCLIVHITGMADTDIISDYIMKPIMKLAPDDDLTKEELIQNCLEVAETSFENDMDRIKLAVMEGRTALFLDGEAYAIIIETRGFEKRSVPDAENEKVVLGPNEGFNESLRTNITLIRRIIKSDDLVVENKVLGGDNNMGIAIIYRDGVANRGLVEEVKRRLAKIKTQTLMSTGVIGQLIEDSPNSPIPQTLSTERPDRTANYVMGGAVALLADGSPFALIMPITISTLMTTSEEIYIRRSQGSLMRFIRYTGAIISLLLPAYFLALALYHQGLLSTEALSTVIQSRQMVFEPLGIEMLLLLFVFQLIREAGLRVPGAIGQAIGIIGGLILGQAAVAANLASSVVLIIVALSGLGNFCVPDYSAQLSASYFRIAFVIAAWLGGLLGLSAAFLVFVAYLANLKSFGVPFLSPYAPKTYAKRPFIMRGKIGMHHRAADYMNTSDDRLKKKYEE